MGDGKRRAATVVALVGETGPYDGKMREALATAQASSNQEAWHNTSISDSNARDKLGIKALGCME